MNIFGIGGSELLLILILAVIVVGPERLTQVAGQIGRAVARFRIMSREMTKEFNEAIGDDLTEIKSAYQEIKGETASAAAEVASAAGDMTVAAEEAAAEPTPAAIEAAQLQHNLAAGMTDGEVTVQTALSETTLEKGPAPRTEAPADAAPMVIEAATLISEEPDAAPLEIDLAEAVDEEEQPTPQEEKR